MQGNVNHRKDKKIFLILKNMKFPSTVFGFKLKKIQQRIIRINSKYLLKLELINNLY